MDNYIPTGMKCSDSIAAPRGRPREFDPEQALTSALRVFWQRGYEGASMAELTEAMGITKPSLYACFGNKEALFKKALDLYERDKLAYVGKALEAPTARGVAERLLNGAIATHCGGDSENPNGCLSVISTVTCTMEDASIRDFVAARRVATENSLIERFERAKQEGDMPETVDPRSLANCLMTVLQGMAVKGQGGSCVQEAKGVVDTFLGMWPGK